MSKLELPRETNNTK